MKFLAASKSEIIVKSLKKCGISNALDGSEDDILYEESDASSENNHEDDFSGSDENFLGFYDFFLLLKPFQRFMTLQSSHRD